MPCSKSKWKLDDTSRTCEDVVEWLCGIQNRLPRTKHPLLSALARQYDIAIVSATAEGAYTTSNAYSYQFASISSAQEDFMARMLESELSIYPDTFLQSCRIKRIILCSNLKSTTKGTTKAVAGVMDSGWFVVDTMILSTSKMQSHNAASSAFHHELFHAIDYRDSADRLLDQQWTALNKRGFRYPGHSSNDPSSEFALVPGFVSKYATVDVWEDKAETYSHLIMDYSKLHARVAKDTILANKVNRIKQLAAAFCPDLNDHFWQTVEAQAQNHCNIKILEARR